MPHIVALLFYAVRCGGEKDKDLQKAMDSREAHHAEVAIVGGGPVGLALAIGLAQRGVRCAVVERNAQPQRIPKGQNLTQRTMEHFHFWGIEKELRAARTIPNDFGIGGMTAYETLLGTYRYDWLQRDLVGAFYFTKNERLPQYETEAVLRRRVAELPGIQTYYGWNAESVSQDGQGAGVGIAERASGRKETLRAAYIVGCDGSRSAVRQQAGITQTLSDHDRRMALLVFRSRELNALVAPFKGKSFFNVLHPRLQGYWQFFGRVDADETWFFHAPVDPGATRDNLDYRALLHAAAGAEFAVEIEYIGFWDLRFAIADEYRKGRIFIAGDAAHSHPPYGGYGINTGFEDAVNLAWKLAATLQGWGGTGLLDSYEEERRPVFASTARDFIARAIDSDRDFLNSFSPQRDETAFEEQWNERATGARLEVNSFAPHYEGSSIVAGSSGSNCGAVGAHAFAARAGHHLTPQPLSSGRSLFEELGEGFTLLALGAEAGTLKQFARAAEEQQVPLKIIQDSRADGRERYEAELVLIRPDQFVAWTSGPVLNARAVLNKAIGSESETARADLAAVDKEYRQ